MEFLKDLGVNAESIESLEKNTPHILINALVDNNYIVSTNINFLKDYGIDNYSEVIKKYPDMFLMDPDKFADIFSKYDKEDTISKVTNNLTIIEYL